MNKGQIVATNTFYQVLSKLITAVLGLLSRRLLTGYLGPAGFGEYVFILTYASIFSGIADWGTLTIGVREASAHPQDKPEIFGTAIITRIILSLLAVGLALLALPLTHSNPQLLSALVVGCLLIFAFTLKASLGIIFETQMRMDLWMIVEVIASAFTLAFLYFNTQMNLPLIYIIWSLLIATIISILIGWYLALKTSKIIFKPQLVKITAYLQRCASMGAALMVFSVYNKLDTLLLKIFRPIAQVGYYGLAYFFYENLVLFAAYFLNSAFPVLSSNLEKKDFSRIYLKLFSVMLVAATGIFITTYIFAPILVKLIAPAEFYPSVILLRILSLSLFFSYLNHVSGYALVALGMQKQYLNATLIALLINVSLNLMLIPRFGSLAAAWVTVATEASMQLFTQKLMYSNTLILLTPRKVYNCLLEIIKTYKQSLKFYGRN